MLNQTELLIILLECLSFYLLKPLIELLQPSLDGCKQLALKSLVKLGLTNEPGRLAQVLGKEQTDRRQWWPRLHNEISAYYEELSGALDKRLNLLEYYDTLIGDHVWSRRATEAMCANKHATNAIALRRLQADTLLKWPGVGVYLEPLDNRLVRLVNWSSADFLVISAHDGEASSETDRTSTSFDWTTFLASISEPASGLELSVPVDRHSRSASTKQQLQETCRLTRRRKSISDSDDSESNFNEARDWLDQGAGQQALRPGGDHNKLTSVPMIGLKRNADKCEESGKQWRQTEAKLIYSSSSEHEALISIRCSEEEQANQAASRFLCWIKHLTLAEYRLHEARSRLVFRLCQRERHFEGLSCLYVVVSSLLERAGLLEPGGFCLRLANQVTRRTKQVAPGEHKLNLISDNKGAESEQTNGEATWWPDTVEMLISDCESHNSISPTRGRLLTRYALFLMLAAYLGQREKQRQLERRQTRHKQLHNNNLASLLAGFLATFGQLVLTDEAGEIDTSVGAAPRQRGGPAAAHKGLEIITVEGVGMPTRAGHVVCEMSISFSDSADSISPRDCDGKFRQLIVLDPAATEVNSSKIGQKLPESHELVLDLTKDLEVWPQISELFTQFHLKLTRPEPGANEARNILSTLLEMSDQCRSKRMVGASWKLDEEERLAMLKDEDDNEETKRPICHLRCTSSPLGRFFATGGSGLVKSRVWKNLLYLVMFLLVRNLLFNHLKDWQRGLKDSARDDFIELKRILLSDSYLAAAEEADAKDDGISILMREENKLDDEDNVEDILEQEQEQEQNSAEADGHADGFETDERRREGEDGEGGREHYNDADDVDERAQIDQALGSLFGGLLSKGLGGGGGGGGGLDAESLQRILGALGDEGNFDMGEMDELLATFQQFMPALMGTAGGGGSGSGDAAANLAKMFADLEVEGEDDDESEAEADHHQEATTKAVEKDDAAGSGSLEDKKAQEESANGQAVNIGSPTASSDPKRGQASSAAPSSHADQSSSTTSAANPEAKTASGAPTREEL